jgi:MFS family permease
MPILFALGLDLMLLLLAALLVKEIQSRDGSEGWMHGVSQVPALLRTGFALTRSNPTLALMLAATATCGFALAGLEGFWQPNFAHLLGGSQGKSLFFGVIMGGNFLVGMLGNLLATPISQRLNRRYGRVCAVFQGLWGMSVILLAMQVSPAPAALLFWLAYMNMGVADSPHNTLLNGEIPSRARSSMLSIASLAGYLGAMTGSAGMGYLAEHASIRLAWIIVGLVLVISLTLYWRIDVLQGEKQAQAKAALADAASGI